MVGRLKDTRLRESWTATHVRALAATGLASSHLHPFLRLVYNDLKTRVFHDARSRTVVVESHDADDDVMCRRQRERNGNFTAWWTTDNGSGEVFALHPAIDWIEVQLWNRFDNGFDVFLGKASVSLHQLQHQCNRGNKELDSLRTGALWFPLQSSETNGVASHISLEIECLFTSDPKALCIQDARHQRRRRSDVKEDKAASVVDPTFALTQPFQPVQWSLIASINVRHLFFHSDIERLAKFRELVLYGDLEKELDDDRGLQIDETYLTAFQMAQFAAQYLDHCVNTLSQRLEDYSDDYRGLAARKGQLRRRHKALTAQQTHLQKEHDNLDLLVTTYERVLEKNGCNKNVDLNLSEQLKGSDLPDQDTSSTDALSLRTSPTGSISSKKPIVLETWKKRERERRLEKEVSKAKQMKSEKQRVLERQQREKYDAIMAKAFKNRKQRAAKRIQALFRDFRTMYHAQRNAVNYQAATRVQTAWKRYVHVKKTLRRLETRNKEMELLYMAQSEQEMRQWMVKKQQDKESTHAGPLLDSTNATEVAGESLSPTASPSKQVVDALVSNWRKLHRVFVLAHESKGIDFQSLFDTIDFRKDKVIDRAELRLGAQSFGVRLDRKITRALITLLRTKCGLPPKPLLVTFEQFVTGFELTRHLAESRDLDCLDEKREFFTDDNENKENASVNGPLVKTSPDTHVKETADEESLINVILDLRAAMYESAMSYLTSNGKLSTDYKAFRDALVHIFSQFDTDQNERIDVNELITSVTPLNLRRTNDQISQLREFFVESFKSDHIGVAEFISFVLAHSSSGDHEQVGVLENRIRETILNRVREVQAQVNSVSEAVRFVLKGAYNDQDQQSCSTRDFMRALIRMRLGVTPAQIVRLVDDLDRDGNCHISFNELLLWLRFRSPVQLAVDTTKLLRVLLEKLMLAQASLISSESQKITLSNLFYHINRDGSGKLKQEELQVFLHAQDLVSLVGEDMLKQLCGLSTLPKDPAAAVAQIIINRLDLDADGVITLREWLTITQHDTSLDTSDPAGVDAMRQILRESEGDDIERIVSWFNELPGTIRAAIGRQGDPTQMQIRVAEFKTALRVKLGGAQAVSMQMINSIVHKLDKDGSGWITTSELCAWVYPPRDLKELLRLVIHYWQKESQQFNDIDLASNLYACFDADGNGSLGVHELRQGFKTFGLTFSEYETRVLLIAFDLDGDGCWAKAEFQAFVNKLFPVQKLVSKSLTNPVQKNTAHLSTEYAISRGRDESSSESAYSNEPFSDSGSDPKEGQDDAQLVDYSEDFVED